MYRGKRLGDSRPACFGGMVGPAASAELIVSHMNYRLSNISRCLTGCKPLYFAHSAGAFITARQETPLPEPLPAKCPGLAVAYEHHGLSLRDVMYYFLSSESTNWLNESRGVLELSTFLFNE